MVTIIHELFLNQRIFSSRLELAKYGVRVITVRPGDFSSLTCGAYQQKQYSNKMWEDMGPTKQKRYAAEFDAFGKAVLNTWLEFTFHTGAWRCVRSQAIGSPLALRIRNKKKM